MEPIEDVVKEVRMPLSQVLEEVYGPENTKEDISSSDFLKTYIYA